ncbi:hypothetical protein Psta_4041 [Pirellula staleyi DSM 6068]|uniref:Uncharacterized protein n=1 Tax=Pirellula staleyi (strain ATCC 27377 / DSM 6068 / ICPB 4128) TaxID=530564 RepID=D2R2W1_PIRSD|nr:hypothetical protein [Pirellula staleyi]ADB18694.1 hypothetical protein Psta_4041 [Pirellula staleyi DSM 6068]
MSSNSGKNNPAIGFFTVCDYAEHGLFGGYLLLNPVGRPLEFHCTSPVRPNRAQEILYGPTLKPFLYGEQIGGALLARTKLPPLLIVTDSEDALAARDVCSQPLVMVLAHDAKPSATLHEFKFKKMRLALPLRYSSDQQAVLDICQTHLDQLDLAEPFARIKEALDEAQKSARAQAA